MKDYKFRINGHDYNVHIKDADSEDVKLVVNGIDYVVTVDRQIKKPSQQKVTERTAPHVTAAANVVQRFNPAATKESNPAPAKPQASSAGSKVVSPLPGTILDVKVNVGDIVKEGQTVVLLEAMKMENNIEADVSGTVKEILVKKGDSVLESDTLVVIG